MRYDEDTKLLLTEVHDHAAHDAAALPDASFFPDNLLLPAGGRNGRPDRHTRAHADADRRAGKRACALQRGFAGGRACGDGGGAHHACAGRFARGGDGDFPRAG